MQRPQRLTVYLAALMTVALLPLGVISLLQTRAVILDADQLSRNLVLARTVAAAGLDRELLQRARGAAKALGVSIVNDDLDDAACNNLMRSYLNAQETFVLAAWIDTSGRMTCSSSGGSFDFSSSDRFQTMMENPELTFELTLSGAVTGQSVIIVTQPAFDGGNLAGFVSLSIPLRLSVDEADQDYADSGIAIALVNKSGEVLASNVAMETLGSLLPSTGIKTALEQTGEHTFFGTSFRGERRLFAFSELLHDEVAVIGSWPMDAVPSSVTPINAGLTLMFPILIWLAGLAIALWGLHRLVIRHLNELRSALRRFALGERGQVLNLDSSTQEFEFIQKSFNRMVILIEEGERQKEQDLKEKTLLLREVHHRVKNNLQLIASIMNMHLRNANTSETRRMLTQLQRRVRGLAMVHHTMNNTSEMVTVDTQILVERLVNELGQRPPINGNPVGTQIDAVSVRLNQDQSVTLSMLLAEALTNAVKYVGVPPGGKPEVAVTLEELPEDRLRLVVFNTRGTTDDTDDDSELSASGGIGQRLMKAFVSQLDGTQQVHETESDYTLEVVFRVEAVTREEPPALTEEMS
ncbi:sensor histidine kinase [Aestuariivita boseongensis]|uniref:sensor histidine kinase n=1 Tax=Aestuariivita boseongensis TaxID=1470562 RepID=UPI000682D4FB|nr:histidine kinase dimerization/phosphoacceptor domain -containing protein [Aestuariivita boseongensis]